MEPLLIVARGLAGVLAYPFALALVVIALASPFMLVSVVRNLARIRKALERIADAGEQSGRGPGGNVLGI